MSRQSISFTVPSSEWLKRKVEIEGEYRSNSEAVNDLIRKAREMEAVRGKGSGREVSHSAIFSTVVLPWLVHCE